MPLQQLQNAFLESQQVGELVGAIGNHTRVHIKGTGGAGDALLIASTYHKIAEPLIVLMSDQEEAAYLFNDLEPLVKKNKVLFFPSSARYPYAVEEVDNANILFRAEALSQLSKRRKNPPIIVTYPEAISESVVTKKHLEKNTLVATVGDNLSIDFINELLFEFEFERVDFVYEPGQFSIRGGIVDIYSYSNEFPYRIEFFGEEIDSIRTFDPTSQLSKAKFENITIVPNVQEKILKEQRESFLEFIRKDSVFFCKELEAITAKIEREYERAEVAYDKLASALNHLKPADLYLTTDRFTSLLESFKTIEFGSQFQHTAEVTITCDQVPQPNFNKNFELLGKNLTELNEKGTDVFIAANNTKQLERIRTILVDMDNEAAFQPLNEAFHSGFIDRNLNLAVYTDHQIFERYHRFKLKEGFKKNKQALTIKELTNLQKGDFVTHIDHGVGRFDGLEKIDNNGKQQEAIRLIYRDNDLLYVSIHSLHRISKFSSSEGTAPKINKLGSPAWTKAKAKAKSKVKQIAFNLIKLYAKRKSQTGFEFAPDTYLQNELEASFIYEDTPDQLKATNDLKRDMEAAAPMDRLVCGDVGFGKTEVAIRAAFKAVADSKQVAILAPTTILTLQHYRTFKKRLEEFPCTVDYINRFKTKKQQTETLKKLANGEIDILIGTHRLTGKDIKFKDLGLLIIDEEQKFGVGAKDKLKTLKANVDTLTLTATPIPRTLQFSLMGARDLSVINTAPPNRQPVTTELRGFSEEAIRDAVIYETSRGGQLFFIHNRVANIQEVAGMIKRLVPNVNVAFAHGQMEGDKLEDIMTAFMEGAYDVLVSTTIIESGLDIPNANTIIINQAQNFGLSDLHQMRGRVGRSNKKAFCYLMTPGLASLTPEARKRLQAIEQFSDLGSGFNIAMKDLDIRGAGDMLGGEQTGFISEIGFEMYQKILDEALEELKKDEFKDLFEKAKEEVFIKDCQIDTDLEILFPDDYVNNLTERLALYKQLDSVKDEEELQGFVRSLTDRFGPLPEPGKDLIDTIRLRWAAKTQGFEKLLLKRQKLIGYFIQDQASAYFQSPQFTQLLDYLQKYPKQCEMKEKNGKLTMSFSNVKSISEANGIMTQISR